MRVKNFPPSAPPQPLYSEYEASRSRERFLARGVARVTQSFAAATRRRASERKRARANACQLSFGWSWHVKYLPSAGAEPFSNNDINCTILVVRTCAKISRRDTRRRGRIDGDPAARGVGERTKSSGQRSVPEIYECLPGKTRKPVNWPAGRGQHRDVDTSI